MALTSQEQKEFIKLQAKCIAKDRTILPDADKKDLQRLLDLAAKINPMPEGEVGDPHPVRIKNFVHSDVSKQLIADGAEFQGVEAVNRGTQDKPVVVYREWLYVGLKGSKDPATQRKALFVQYLVGHQADAKVIEAGRTIAAAAYRRFQNKP